MSPKLHCTVVYFWQVEALVQCPLLFPSNFEEIALEVFVSSKDMRVKNHP